MEPENADAIFAFTRLLLPEATDWPGLRGLMGLVLTSLQGAAVSTLAFGPGLDLSEAKVSLIRAVEGALAEAATWVASPDRGTAVGS